MKLRIPFLAYFLFFSSLSFFCKGQQHTLRLTIKNQPDTPIILGWIKGDDFIKMDSTKANSGQIKFNIPSTAHAGVYRIILGKTTYARVMDEAPQQIDFIFNNEDIMMETDFNHPKEKLKVTHSEENKLWYSFLIGEKEYTKNFKILENELNAHWGKKDTSNALAVANNFNRLQMEWDLRLSQTVQQNNKLYASKLMAISRKPILDGFLSPEERKEQLKTDFLKNSDFSNEELIYSAAYTDKVFDYLVLYNQPGYTQEKRAEVYIKAVDIILPYINQNEKVAEFIITYLIHGFEVLKLEKVIEHIRENY